LIGTTAEYQRVQQLTAVLVEALRLMGAGGARLDAEWHTFLRDAYAQQLNSLGRELRQFERSHHLVSPANAALHEEARMAERRIEEIRHDMFLLRERMQDIDPLTLQDCDRLALLDAQLAAHEDLIGEWLAYRAELLATLTRTGLRLHVNPQARRSATS